MSVHALNSLCQPICQRASSAEFPQLRSQAPSCVTDAGLSKTVDYSKLLQSQPTVLLWVGPCSPAGDLVFRCQDVVRSIALFL
jgi:hypothetical protein